MAVSQTRTNTRAIAEPQVGLSLTACLRAQRPDQPCAACATACPENAIQITGRSVAVQPMSCSGCGICATACPTGAIEVSGFASANLLECSRVGKPEGATVPCLGGVTADMLRVTLATGDVVLMDRGWCAECPVSNGRARPWANALAVVNEEMGALGLSQRVRVEDRPLAQWRARAAPRSATENPGRRSLFNRFAAGGTVAPKHDTVPNKVETPGRARRLSALSELSPEQPVPRALFPAFEMAQTSADWTSIAQLCPTSALFVDDTKTQRALIFDPAACITCGACTDTGALRRIEDPEGAFTGPETLARELRATCNRCRARFTPKPGQTNCTACARDNDLAALAHGLMRRNPIHDNSK